MSNKKKKKKKNEAKRDVQEKGPTLPVCTIAEATRICRYWLSHHYDQGNESLNQTAVTTTKRKQSLHNCTTCRPAYHVLFERFSYSEHVEVSSADFRVAQFCHHNSTAE